MQPGMEIAQKFCVAYKFACSEVSVYFLPVIRELSRGERAVTPMSYPVLDTIL